MEVVTPRELAEFFERLTASIEALGAKVTAQGCGEIAEYFTREEAAQYLRLSTRTFDKLVSDGAIRRAKLGDTQQAMVRFRRRDLDAFFERKLEMSSKEARTHARRLR